mmetsp:Transcript_549/g.1498  ORF Transcript_549/g.1498 Transcript_549/m.1498 type:complete len:236 (-) Transcript_549:304-1011(-)
MAAAACTPTAWGSGAPKKEESTNAKGIRTKQACDFPMRRQQLGGGAVDGGTRSGDSNMNENSWRSMRAVSRSSPLCVCWPHDSSAQVDGEQLSSISSASTPSPSAANTSLGVWWSELRSCRSGMCRLPWSTSSTISTLPRQRCSTPLPAASVASESAPHRPSRYLTVGVCLDVTAHSSGVRPRSSRHSTSPLSYRNKAPRAAGRPYSAASPIAFFPSRRHTLGLAPCSSKMLMRS